MRVIPVELDAETVAALEVERELLGFENRSTYIRWLLEHRATIDHRGEADRPVLLEAYRERIAQLEERLVAAESSVPDPAVTRVPRGVDSSGTDGSGDGGSNPGVEYEAGDGGWTPSRSDPTVKVRGSPRTTVVSDSDGDGNEGEDGAEGENSVDTGTGMGTDTNAESMDNESVTGRVEKSETGPEAETGRETQTKTEPRNENQQQLPSRTDAETAPDSKRELALESATDENEVISAMNLTPERVERIREDPVAEDAGVLGTVELDRLDELSRRAVAKTRKRLDRNVETGLEYTSSTSLAADDVRPGEDVVDLETLSVRGRSAETVERRREVAGHAIAFLRDRGRARRSDFVDALYEEYPAGYDTADSWWRYLKEALKQVDAIDGGEGARVWRFRQ